MNQITVDKEKATIISGKEKFHDLAPNSFNVYMDPTGEKALAGIWVIGEHENVLPVMILVDKDENWVLATEGEDLYELLKKIFAENDCDWAILPVDKTMS